MTFKTTCPECGGNKIECPTEDCPECCHYCHRIPCTLCQGKGQVGLEVEEKCVLRCNNCCNPYWPPIMQKEKCDQKGVVRRLLTREEAMAFTKSWIISMTASTFERHVKMMIRAQLEGGEYTFNGHPVKVMGVGK